MVVYRRTSLRLGFGEGCVWVGVQSVNPSAGARGRRNPRSSSWLRFLILNQCQTPSMEALRLGCLCLPDAPVLRCSSSEAVLLSPF